MGDIINKVDNKEMVGHVNMVNFIDMVNKQQTFGNLKLAANTSGCKKWTW